MHNKTFFIFTFSFLILSASCSKVQIQGQQQKCNPSQKQAYLAFYETNRQAFDLFVPMDTMKPRDCFFQLFVIDGAYRTIFWMPATPNTLELPLFVSLSSPSHPLFFEENLEIPLLKGSMNETLLKEKSGELQRDDRVAKWVNVFVTVAQQKFDVQKKKKYFETLYLMHMMNFEKMMNILIADFFGMWLAKGFEDFFQNWEQDMLKHLKHKGGEALQKLYAEFQQALDMNVAKNTFKKVQGSPEFVQQEFQKVMAILGIYADEDLQVYGRNSISNALNSMFNPLTLEDLVTFYKDFAITIDKKLTLDFQVQLEGQNQKEQFANLVHTMAELDEHYVQFFLLEKFELLDMKRPVKKSASFGSMVSKTPADNCGLTNNKKIEFITLGVNEKYLDASAGQKALQIYVRCVKTVDVNAETFKIILKPDGKQECTMVVYQYDKGEGQFDAEAMVDTFPEYGSDISCLRYTRSVNNMFLLI